MTQNRAAFALSDLKSIIQSDEEKTMEVSDFGNIKHLVSKCDPNAGLPEELSDKVDDMLKRMLQGVLDEACCMLMFSVSSSHNKKYYKTCSCVIRFGM